MQPVLISEMFPLEIAVKNDQFVWARCPVRLDLAGGWTDTPPYTLLYGGKVVNVAVNLNGQPPVQVYVRKTSEKRIRVQSIDLGAWEDICELHHLAGYDQPGSAFALVKAALIQLGFTKEQAAGQSLAELLSAIGGGLEITLFVAVPKGSGLGVSSILAATILGALHRFLGHTRSVKQLTEEVLQLEQMLTTGGGWQDQVGGVVGGVKFTESRPGDKLNFDVEHLDEFLFRSPAADCLTLYYTGMTRLAKNILEEVVARVKSGDPLYLALHDWLKNLAERMRSALSRRNLGQFAILLDQSWEANKRIHSSVTNGDVEALLAEAKPHFLSAKLLGAGGGGYCLFVSQDSQQADRLRQALAAHQHDSARLVDFALNSAGLEVSVS